MEQTDKPLYEILTIQDALPTLDIAAGRNIRMKRVNYRLRDNTLSFVDVPAHELTAAVVDQLVSAEAARHFEVVSLKGPTGMPQAPGSDNPWSK